MFHSNILYINAIWVGGQNLLREFIQDPTPTFVCALSKLEEF